MSHSLFSLPGNDDAYDLYILPIHYMLKDNADDIRDKIHLDEQGIKLKGASMLDKIKDEAMHKSPKNTLESL